MMGLLEAVVGLARDVVQMVRDGASDEEIRQRIADPQGVGQKLIDAARGRKKRIADFVEGG